MRVRKQTKKPPFASALIGVRIKKEMVLLFGRNSTLFA